MNESPLAVCVSVCLSVSYKCMENVCAINEIVHGKRESMHSVIGIEWDEQKMAKDVR